MRVLLIRNPEGPESGTGDTLLHIRGIEHLETVNPSLRAIAVIRALQPDLVVMETDGCESDSISLLNWIRTGDVAPHTILIGEIKPRELRGSAPARENLYCFELPREQDDFHGLVAELAKEFRPRRAKAKSS